MDPLFGYGLGLFSIRTVCGTIWGHEGSVPGFTTFAFNDAKGERNLVLMVTTTPDDQIGPLLDLAFGTAVCEMLGQNTSRAIPQPVNLGRSAASSALLR